MKFIRLQSRSPCRGADYYSNMEQERKGKDIMPFEWTEDLETGVALIDGQHKSIFDALNTLLNAMDEGKGKRVVEEALGFLENYVNTHFHDEEDLMARHNYRGYLAHKAEHAQFRKDFDQLKKEFTHEGATLYMVVQTEQKMVDWLMNHIKLEDKKMAETLKNSDKDFKNGE